MSLSQRCQYSLRAIFELTRCEGKGPVKVSQIAERQSIPGRFLEVLLGQLKQAGFVTSVRGPSGGYVLGKDPAVLTVGDIIRFCDGPITPVDCIRNRASCSFKGDCVFLPMWKKATKALEDVYDKTTFADLYRQETAGQLDFSI